MIWFQMKPLKMSYVTPLLYKLIKNVSEMKWSTNPISKLMDYFKHLLRGHQESAVSDFF